MRPRVAHALPPQDRGLARDVPHTSRRPSPSQRCWRWAARLILAALVLTACVRMPPPKRTVVVLLDETGSFSDLWAPALADVAEVVVPALQPDEQFVVIGIDDRGFEDRDVRLGLVRLSSNSLAALSQRSRLAAQVRSLKPRVAAAPGSDIAEALLHATHFLRRGAAEGYRPVLLVFSDLVPDFARPRNPTEAAELGHALALPPDTMVRFLYVRERQSATWQRTVRLWLEVFRAAGVNVSEQDFYLPAESRQAVAGVMR